jgi:hypothetical protein
MHSKQLEELISTLEDLKNFILINDTKTMSVEASRELRAGMEAVAEAINCLTEQLKAHC